MTSAETQATRSALRRDGERKLLLGVCAGIARMLDADPALVRGATILFGLVAGPLAVVAYVAVAVIAPRDDGRMLLGGAPPDRRETLIGWGGVALASIFVLTAAPGFGPLFVEDPVAAPWAIVALALGLWVLVRAGRDRAATVPVGDPAPPSGVDAPSPPPPASEASTDVVLASPGVRVPPTGGHRRAEEEDTLVQPSPPEPATPPGRSVFAVVMGALVAFAGIAIVAQATGAVDLDADGVAILLAAGALVSGAAAAVGAGRRGTGLTLAVGILLALCAATVSLAANELDDGIGVRTVRPASATELDREYRLGMGLLEIDLRETALPSGTPATVNASLGFGEIELHVPDDVRVESVGETVVSGRLAPLDPPSRGRQAPVVRLDADVRAGDARVIRDGP